MTKSQCPVALIITKGILSKATLQAKSEPSCSRSELTSSECNIWNQFGLVKQISCKNAEGVLPRIVSITVTLG